MDPEAGGRRPLAAAVGRSVPGLVGLAVVGGGAGALLAGTAAGEWGGVGAVPGLGVVRELTGLGSPVAAAVVLALVWSALVLHGRSRPAAFVAVTALGAGVLGAGATGVAAALTGPAGSAGPSGHALSAVVAHGVLAVVVAPAVPPGRHRTAVTAAAVVLVVLLGLTRLVLGEPPSRVLLGAVLGAGWLAVTTTAFGRPGAGELAPPRPAAPRAGAAPRWRAGALAGTLLVLLGLVVAAGTAVTGSPSVQRADAAGTGWFVTIRTPVLTAVAEVGSALGDTPTVVAGVLALAVLAATSVRGARPVLVVVLVLGGELALFLVSGAVVGRPRPAVDLLGLLLPPTSSFPSGHVSAAVCLYGLAAVLAARLLRPGRRWLPVAAAVLTVAGVAFGRLYYGVHHPTDVLASLLFAVPWLLACLRLGPDPRPRSDR